MQHFKTVGNYKLYRYYKSINLYCFHHTKYAVNNFYSSSELVLKTFYTVIPDLKFVWLCSISGVLIYSLTALGHFLVCITPHSKQAACVSFRSLFLPEKAFAGHICHLI